MSGLDKEETNGYLSIYKAFAFSAGKQYSLANSSFKSRTIDSSAPQARARFLITSMSSPPWPTSAATAMTSFPVSSLIQPMATEVSSPPEYAKTTFSLTFSPFSVSYSTDYF